MIRTPLNGIVIEWPWNTKYVWFMSPSPPFSTVPGLVFVCLGGPGLADMIVVIIPPVSAKACILSRTWTEHSGSGWLNEALPSSFSPTGRKEGPTDERIQGNGRSK
jgi:hypothetical protein